MSEWKNKQKSELTSKYQSSFGNSASSWGLIWPFSGFPYGRIAGGALSKRGALEALLWLPRPRTQIYL
jgi:hypothetical protein